MNLLPQNANTRTWILLAQALFSTRAADELKRRRDAAAAAKKRAAAEAKAKADADYLDDIRRQNYNDPINFLASSVGNPAPFPQLSPYDWRVKKYAWQVAGTYEAMYASTDPVLGRERCGAFGGKYAGQPYPVVEAEVRRLCMAP